jgi:hypothetical protein
MAVYFHPHPQQQLHTQEKFSNLYFIFGLSYDLFPYKHHRNEKTFERNMNGILIQELCTMLWLESDHFWLVMTLLQMMF